VGIVFDGEYINAETQETQALNGVHVQVVRGILRGTKDGDALVVNAREEREDWR